MVNKFFLKKIMMYTVKCFTQITECQQTNSKLEECIVNNIQNSRCWFIYEKIMLIKLYYIQSMS